MTKYVHGWGTCSVCGRTIASTAKGAAWRHGRRKMACEGSGKTLLNRKKIQKWLEAVMIGV